MRVWTIAVLLSLMAGTATAQPAVLAPYSPTPLDVVERMLKLARVGPQDVVYDLGCGDGRMVIAAARLFGAAEAQREAIHYVIEPSDLPHYERCVGSTRASLTPETFDSAWADGRALTLDEAVAWALGN